MKTFTNVRQVIAAVVEKMRESGASDDEMARAFVALDDCAVSYGCGQEELDALLAKVPEGSCRLLVWVALHPKLELEEGEEPGSS